MKKLIVLLLILPLFFACTDDTSSSSEPEPKPDPKPIEKALVELANLQDLLLSHGTARSKIMLLYPLPKQNTFLLAVVVPKFFG